MKNKNIKSFGEFNENLNISDVSESNWRETESNIEPWGKDMELMDKLLDEFEKQYYPLDEHSWEEIQEIKKRCG